MPGHETTSVKTAVRVLGAWRLPCAIVAGYAVLFTLVFAEPLLSGRLLAPGDGWLVHLPAFYAPWTLWSLDLYSGFPIAAEPLTQSYYPLAWLFARLHAWNAYIICAYVLAASFTCGYLYTLTGSVIAGVVAGIIYGMSGFFFGHLGHATIIHGAAWVPLLFWGLERARRSTGSAWLVVTGAAVALCTVGTHPQVLVYGLGLAGMYVLVMGGSAMRGRWRYYAASGAAVLTGLAAAAVQLIPTGELGYLSQRAAMTLDEAMSFALPPREALQPLFPFLFGSAGLAPYGTPFFGTWTLAETGGYIGWVACLGAVTALMLRWRDRVVQFWAAAAVAAFLLTLGSATPLWWVVQQVPGYSWFRCPGRHFLEVGLAMATLAGLGVAALARGGGRRAARRSAASVLLFAVSAALLIGWRSDALFAGAAARGAPRLSGWPWANPAVGIPFAVAAVSAAVFLWYARNPRRPMRAALLVLVAAADLGSAGRVASQPGILPDRTIVEMPAPLSGYRERVRAGAARILSFDPGGPPASAPVNLNRLWDIPNVNGASSIPVLRYATAVPWLDTRLFSSDNRVLDLLATRYVTRVWRWEAGFQWGLSIESALGRRGAAHIDWSVPNLWASRIALIGALHTYVPVADGTVVATLRAVTAEGIEIERPLRAGDDLNDPLSDEPGGRRGSGAYDINAHPAVIDLGGRHQLRRIELERADPRVAVRIVRASVRDDETGVSYPVEPGISDPDRWRRVDDFAGVSVFENQRALPRAWVVGAAVRLHPDQILQAIQHSTLPDGEAFDPHRTALVEESVDLPGPSADLDAEVGVSALTDTRIELDARSARDAFLVLSDVAYPGWEAHIDGQAAHIYQTDYLLRGVALPAGRHAVTFTYRPRSFIIGLVVSLLSLGVLLFGALRAISRHGIRARRPRA